MAQPVEMVRSEEQCWELAALAALLSDAQGAYSGPVGTTRIFFTFGGVRLTGAG